MPANNGDDDDNHNNNNDNRMNRKHDDPLPPNENCNSLIAQTLQARLNNSRAATGSVDITAELFRRIQQLNGMGRFGAGGGGGRGRAGASPGGLREERSLLQILDNAIDLVDQHRARTTTEGVISRDSATTNSDSIDAVTPSSRTATTTTTTSRTRPRNNTGSTAAASASASRRRRQRLGDANDDNVATPTSSSNDKRQ